MFAVVNHLHLTIPVEQLRQGVEDEAIPLLAAVEGFRGFYFVQEAPDRAIVILMWESGESAAKGAQLFGPTWFAKHIAPNLASCWIS